MNGRERLQAVFEGRIPDKVPHFEMVFQIPEAAFGLSWPTWPEMAAAKTDAERSRLLDKSLDIWEKIIERYDYAAVQIPVNYLGLVGEPAKRARKRWGDRVMLYDFNGGGTFWMMPGTEMMAFTELLYLRPDEAHAQARAKRDASIGLARTQVDHGADFIIINSDYAYNQGPFVSPKMFAEFITPYLAEIVAKMHEFGVPAILHSDGDMSLILDQIVSTGMDGYQSVDPQANMDIAEVRRLFPNLLLMGNVKTSLLQHVDDPAIRESVRYCMNAAKPGGRYIFSTSNCIFNGMPLESYHVMLDEYEKLAWYGR